MEQPSDLEIKTLAAPETMTKGDLCAAYLAFGYSFLDLLNLNLAEAFYSQEGFTRRSMDGLEMSMFSTRPH